MSVLTKSIRGMFNKAWPNSRPEVPENVANLAGVAPETERQAFVISKLDTSRRGIEIAPYFNPLVSKKRYDVWYVDCIDNDEIQSKAAQNPGGIGKDVPRIDSVWVPGKKLSECVNGQTFRYAVASHVFEHVPNPIGWVNGILDCLEVGGKVALLIPLRRSTMDYYRRETTFGELMGWYLDEPKIPTAGQVMDFLSQSFEHTGHMDFGNMPPFTEIKRHYSDAVALDFARMVAKSGHYLDVHCTTWTPECFMEVFQRVLAVGVMQAKIHGPFEGFPGSIPGEFLVYFEKTG